MKTLFPEMDAEIASDRLAERREAVQRPHHYLKDKAGYESWILSRLAKSPAVDANMMLEISELVDLKNEHRVDVLTPSLNIMFVAYAMWRVGKIARKPFPNHPCNEPCFIYSLKP